MRDKDIKKLIDIASDGEEQSVDSEEIKKELMDKISKISIKREYSDGETVKPKYVTAFPKAKKYLFTKITAGAAAVCLVIGAIGTAAYKNSYGSKQLLPFESDNISDTVQYTLSESTSDLQPEISENEPQIFTEDFDGIVMTVTTDKTRYVFDEIIKVTASVKNNRNEAVKLYVGTTTPAHQEISTEITRNGRYLCDPVTETCMDCAENNIIIEPGEEYVQEMNYETYFSAEFGKTQKLAEEGLYSGKSTILLLTDTNDSSERGFKNYSLIFSLILGSETDPQHEFCENKPQTFTRDFDGILMTVKTDKRRYQIDEPIHVEASVKNTTDKAIRLFVPCLGDSHKQIDTIIYNKYTCLIDVDTFMQFYDQMIDVVTIEPNEEYTQSMTYETYTGIDTSSRKQAEEGLYFGESVIRLIDDSAQSLSDGNYTFHSLNFSLVIGSPSFAEPLTDLNPGDYEITLLDGTVVKYHNEDTDFTSGDDSNSPIIKERDRLYFSENGKKRDITDQMSADEYFCFSYVHPHTGLTHYLIAGGNLKAKFFGYIELFWLPGDNKRAYVVYKYFTEGANNNYLDGTFDSSDAAPNSDWLDQTLNKISDTLKEKYNIIALVEGSTQIKEYPKFPDTISGF